MNRFSSRGGFTLLEVLVALLIFSLGLLGMAGLLSVSVRTNHSAYVRTQVTFLAQALADRMRSNNLGLWANSYNVSLTTSAATTVPSTCNFPATCASADMATRDLAVWVNQLVAFLPASQYRVNCALAAGATVPDSSAITKLPPYTGTCEIEIKWKDVSLEQANSTTSFPQDFDWVFEP